MIDTSWIDDIIEKNEKKREERQEDKREEIIQEEAEEQEEASEADDAMREMYEAQERYEEELNRYPDTHPKNLFKHDFLRPQYLPVVTAKGKKTVEADPDEVAKELIREAYNISPSGNLSLNHVTFCRIWHERFNYVYAGFILTPDGQIDPDTFKSEIVKMLFNMNAETKNLDVLAEHIYKTYISAYKMDAYADEYRIPFRNGDLVLNKDKKGFTFYEGSKAPVPYRFGYDFKNVKNCFEPKFPNFKRWRDELFDEEDIYSLKQMLGYLLMPSNEAQEAFFIVGKGGSGKSILTDCIIPKMIGEAMFPISFKLFFNNQFQASTSEGKLCMVDDDIGGTNMTNDDAGRFKKFVSAKTIQIEHKHCNPVKINNSARIVCSGNHMIKSDDKTDGFIRRLHPIYVKPRTIERVDRQFPKKIEKEIEMIVLWALEGLLEMLGNGGAPYMSEKTVENLKHYAEGQKWEEQFIEDCFEYKESTVTYSQELKDALAEWMKENSELCGEGSVSQKFAQVSQWLKDEGEDKNGFIYKRGIKKGDKYNARGYINMSPKSDIKQPRIWTDEKGAVRLRITRKKAAGDVES